MTINAEIPIKAIIFSAEDRSFVINRQIRICTCIVEAERDVRSLLRVARNEMADGADEKAKHCTRKESKERPSSYRLRLRAWWCGFRSLEIKEFVNCKLKMIN